MFERFENQHADHGGGARCADRGQPLRSAPSQQHDSYSSIAEAITKARRETSPDAKPSRRTPAVHLPHDPVVAVFDEALPGTCELDSHGLTSRGRT